MYVLLSNKVQNEVRTDIELSTTFNKEFISFL